jgi:hypothetical protein
MQTLMTVLTQLRYDRRLIENGDTILLKHIYSDKTYKKETLNP